MRRLCDVVARAMGGVRARLDSSSSFWRLSIGGFAAAAVALACLSAMSLAKGGTRFFVGDYETGNLSQWHGLQAMASDRAVVVSSPVRQGGYAAMFTVKPGDDVNGWPGERSTVFATVDQTRGTDGQDVWYAWSSMIAPGSVLSSSWNDLTSWHQTGPTCPAPLHFALTPRWKLYLRNRGGRIGRGCSSSSRGRWSFGTFRTGVWYDFLIHVKWSANPSVGFVEVWINGKQVLPLTHTATLYAGQSVYFKQGFYRGSTSSGNTVVYNDGNVIASSYADAITAFPAGSWPSKPERGVAAKRVRPGRVATTLRRQTTSGHHEVPPLPGHR